MKTAELSHYDAARKVVSLAIDEVQFVKELYPRLREDDAAVERYRAAIDKLPPIIVARGRVLVDGFHRWQAYRREHLPTIPAEDLGNLTDIEILKESIRRNSSHGRQLEVADKRRMVDKLYRQGTRDIDELTTLLSITRDTAVEYARDARRDEKQAQKEAAWDRWLNCETQSEIAKAIGVDDTTIKNWIGEFSNALDISPPESRQHFDIWSFQKAEGESSYFGKMPPQVVENLLWLYTEPGQVVVDPFAGGGTTIDVAKRMGRRVWASDLNPSTPTLPIHKHDIVKSWPADAPQKADFIVLDPPYWQQAKGKYSESDDDLGNQPLEKFMKSWSAVASSCRKHLAKDGRIAFIVSPTQTDANGVVDHALEMWRACCDAGFVIERRIVVPYQTQQATGQQVEWARKERKLLKLYRDLVVMR